MNDTQPALSIDRVTHRYGEREALSDLSLRVEPGQMFGLLGPNGSGKSTLFRLISTLVPVQSGQIQVFGNDTNTQQAAVRAQLGVVFQQPALDKQLTVAENIYCHGRLYQIDRRDLHARTDAMLQRFGLTDRRNDKTNDLSGGMRRKVELVKALITRPRLLILDEPSTGLDVSARLELWALLAEMRAETALTIVVTTHLMDEADRCDQLAILHRGRLISNGSPSQLKQELGGNILTLTGPDPKQLSSDIAQRFSVQPQVIDRTLRIEQSDAEALVPQLLHACGPQIDQLTVGRPTLDDVFVRLTGERLGAER